MMRAKRIVRLAALLAPLSLAGCNSWMCSTCNETWYQQLLKQLQAMETPSSTASTLSQDTTDLSTDPWWGGGNTPSPMAPSN